MKDSLKVALAVIASLAILFGLAYYGLSMNRFFAPREEALRRQVFEQSVAYNQGMIRDLENIEMQYIQATPEAKAALRSIALHRFEIYPEDSLTPHLQAFYNQLKATP